MKIYTTVLILISLSAFNSKAQKVNGTLVNTQLDSIEGEFIFPLTNTSKNEYVFMNDGSGKVKVPATQILSLTVDGINYMPLKINDNYHIAKCSKCEGFLHSMRYKPINDSQYTVELLRKMDGSFIEVPTFGFKSAISDFLGDCPETMHQLNELKYRRKKLDSLITSYNNCKAAELEKMEEPDEFTAAISAIENSDDISDQNKKEIIDILNSMKRRKNSEEEIPNYLINSLKELTNGKKVESEITTLLKAINN